MQDTINRKDGIKVDKSKSKRPEKNKKQKNPWPRRVLYLAVALLTVSYMVYMIVATTVKKIETDYAIAYKCHETVSADAYIMREETIIYRDTDGVLAYNAQNGTKVVAGSVVAEVYSDEEGAKNRSRIDQIDKTLESLGGIGNSGDKVAANAQTIEGKIGVSIQDYVYASQSGSYEEFVKAKTDLLGYLNKKQIATGQTAGISSYAQQLKAERDSLSAQLNPVSQVLTEKAGFFIKSSDGYENVLSVENLDALTVEGVKNALESKPAEISSRAVGRVCTSDEWYMTTVLPYTSVLHVKEGEEVTVTIPLLSFKELRCTVKRMSTDMSTKDTLLVLSCTDMDEGLAHGRKEKIEIRINSHDGLRINSSAIRKLDNSITGVYVLSGVSAKFVPVNVLYSDTGFAVCEYDPKTAGTLKVYDEVITKGTNLYDGKVVR